MPTPEHEALIEAFRRNPALTLQILERCKVTVPPGAKPKVVEATLNQLQPTEYRADLVIELTQAKRICLSIVLEVQLTRDEDKKYSWPVYVAARRALTRAPVVLLVITFDAGVAAWAREPIELGPGMGTFTPLVVDLGQVERVTDPEVAQAAPELSFLSAMGHGNDPDGVEVLKALLVALGRLDPAQAVVYFAAVHRVLRGASRAWVEAYLMSLQDAGAIELPEFLQRMLDAREEKGVLKGEARGKAEGEATSILRVLARRNVPVSEEVRARILACRDLAKLDRWLDKAITARSVDEVLAEP